MKKLFLIASFIVLGTTATQAQDYWNFGIKGGANFATIANEDGENPDGRTSFNVGAMVEIPVSDKFSIQPEVLYSAQGATLASFDEDNTFDVDDNVDYQLDYIQVPVLAKIYLVEGLSVQVGPSFNFLANEEIDFDPTSDSGDIDIEDGANGFEFGGAVGLEYKFANGFLIQGRYTRGFSEIYDNADGRNSVVQAGIGFMF